jgi:RNA polymerase sigma-70 factor (TIGR02960 family)
VAKQAAVKKPVAEKSAVKKSVVEKAVVDQAADVATQIAAAMGGDEAAFARLAQRYRRELHVHCYRMLASFDEAEDAVQETLLNAWRALDGFDGSMLFRAWLYRIATNVCLDQLRRNARRLAKMQSLAEVPWLQPYPDRMLDEAAPIDQQPDAVAVDRETIELAFLAAMQLLPPRQRATFIVRDVLGWPADQTAGLLGTSVAAANSALQRARTTMQQNLATSRAEWSAPTLSTQDKQLLEQFIDAHERGDAVAAIAISAQDIRITMPPYPYLFDGIDAMRTLLERAFGDQREGDWRLLPTAANRLPAAASYLRRFGDSRYRAFKLDVLRPRGPVIAEVTTFGPGLFAAFGLPEVLPEAA